MNFVLNSFTFNNEYFFSVLLFNIFSYIFTLVNIFIIFFLFDLKYVKTLNELKFFGNLPFVTLFLTIIILSFAGIPPLLGFVSKFIVFVFIISKNSYFFIFLFTFSNMFIIYFYIQNLRFVVSKKIKSNYIIKNRFVNFNNSLIMLINIFNFFTVFSIFYLEEIIIFFNLISSFYNF